MNGNLIWLVGAGVIAFTLLLFLGIRAAIERRNRKWQELATPPEEQSGVLVRRIEAQRQAGAASRFDQSFDNMIDRTGLEIKPVEALGMILLTGVIFAGLFYLIREELWLVILGFVLGMAVVTGIFLFLQRRYRRLLQDQLPESIFLISSSLRAGMSLDQAIMVVGEHGAQPLSKEFSRCGAQIALGLPAATAVEAMASRLQLLDLNILASTLAMYQTTGGNLPLLLDRLGQSVRDRNNFRSYLRSATGLGRVTAIFLLAFVPVTLLVYALAQPDHVKAFFTSTTGWILLAVAVGLQLFGAFVIYRLLKIEY